MRAPEGKFTRREAEGKKKKMLSKSLRGRDVDQAGKAVSSEGRGDDSRTERKVLK